MESGVYLDTPQTKFVTTVTKHEEARERRNTRKPQSGHGDTRQ